MVTRTPTLQFCSRWSPLTIRARDRALPFVFYRYDYGPHMAHAPTIAVTFTKL